MATTPKGIYYPEGSTNSNFVSIFSALASSIDAALGDFTYDSGWINVQEGEFLNGWESYNTGSYQVAYRKIGLTVYHRGLIRYGTEGTAMYIVPEGFRPTRGSEIFYTLTSGTLPSSGGLKGTRVQVVSGGTVSQVGTNTALGKGFISLNPIIYVTDEG